ncbi:MAG: carbohydrate ABC transporter permease [Clostridiales bacterium]|jgi:putative aldouronate transport system permease protein|nr:carbohydrate ABC transporter permease [Clostridiales bacterium]
MVEAKKSPSFIIQKICVYGALAAISLICVLPFWHMIMESLSDPLELTANKGFLWLPITDLEGAWSFDSYKIIFSFGRIWRSYLNTVIYTVSATALGLVISAMAAYVLSRRDLMFKKPLMIFFLITLFFSGGLIPTYIVVHSLGLANTMLALIIPGCCNAFFMILIKNGMDALPYEYYEAARIDGAGHWFVFTKIILPLTGPFMAVTALFGAVGHWNSWVAASLYINSRHPELYPLQLVLRDILVNSNVQGIKGPSGLPIAFYLRGIQAASVVVGSLPLLIIYPFVQKYFEKGIVLGGVKG